MIAQTEIQDHVGGQSIAVQIHVDVRVVIRQAHVQIIADKVSAIILSTHAAFLLCHSDGAGG